MTKTMVTHHGTLVSNPFSFTNITVENAPKREAMTAIVIIPLLVGRKISSTIPVRSAIPKKAKEIFVHFPLKIISLFISGLLLYYFFFF